MEQPAEPEFAWLMFIGILLMFLLSMAVVIFFVYYQRKLHGQQTAIEHLKLEEQKKLLLAEITAQEKERERIAQDLHDEVGVLLSTAKLYLTAEKEAKHTKKTENILNEAVQKLRSISQDLLPENLKLFGLSRAIEHSCNRLEEIRVFSIDFESKLKQRLSSELELHLYRIAQELLNNAIKHSKASAVRLKLYQEEKNVVLVYNDNGIGFLTEEKSKGLGLTTLKSRVQLLNGNIGVISQPDKGVEAVVICPLST